MKKTAFLDLKDQLLVRGNIPEYQHEYFLSHQSRLLSTLSFFGLWELANTRLLEIGPFFAFTPFLYRQNGCDVTVLEGTDPVIGPLLPLYHDEGIRCDQFDLAQVLGKGNSGRLPYADASFDSVICFETMEHFNFNPVFFARELYRILAPGGRAYITVPNQAKLDMRLRLLAGRPIRTPIAEYYHFADYHGGEFLGFHWREYLLSEVVELFSRSGFEVEIATYLNSFIDRPDASLGRRFKRTLGRAVIALVPSAAQNCVVRLKKPEIFATDRKEA